MLENPNKKPFTGSTVRDTDYIRMSIHMGIKSRKPAFFLHASEGDYGKEYITEQITGTQYTLPPGITWGRDKQGPYLQFNGTDCLPTTFKPMDVGVNGTIMYVQFSSPISDSKTLVSQAQVLPLLKSMELYTKTVSSSFYLYRGTNTGGTYSEGAFNYNGLKLNGDWIDVQYIQMPTSCTCLGASASATIIEGHKVAKSQYTTSANPLVVDVPLVIGGRRATPTTYERIFTGKIRTVAIWRLQDEVFVRGIQCKDFVKRYFGKRNPGLSLVEPNYTTKIYLDLSKSGTATEATEVTYYDGATTSVREFKAGRAYRLLNWSEVIIQPLHDFSVGIGVSLGSLSTGTRRPGMLALLAGNLVRLVNGLSREYPIQEYVTIPFNSEVHLYTANGYDSIPYFGLNIAFSGTKGRITNVICHKEYEEPRKLSVTNMPKINLSGGPRRLIDFKEGIYGYQFVNTGYLECVNFDGREIESTIGGRLVARSLYATAVSFIAGNFNVDMSHDPVFGMTYGYDLSIDMCLVKGPSTLYGGYFNSRFAAIGGQGTKYNYGTNFGEATLYHVTYHKGLNLGGFYPSKATSIGGSITSVNSDGMVNNKAGAFGMRASPCLLKNDPLVPDAKIYGQSSQPGYFWSRLADKVRLGSDAILGGKLVAVGVQGSDYVGTRGGQLCSWNDHYVGTKFTHFNTVAGDKAIRIRFRHAQTTPLVGTDDNQIVHIQGVVMDANGIPKFVSEPPLHSYKQGISIPIIQNTDQWWTGSTWITTEGRHIELNIGFCGVGVMKLQLAFMRGQIDLAVEVVDL